MKDSSKSPNLIAQFVFYSFVLLPFFYLGNVYSVFALGKAFWARLIIPLTIFGWGLHLFIKGRKKQDNSNTYSLMLPILSHLFAILISTIFSTDFATSYFGSYERQLGLQTYILYFLGFFFLAALVSKSCRIDRFILVFFISAAVMALETILQGLSMDPIGWFPMSYAPFGFTGNSGYLSCYISLILPFGMYFIYKSARVHQKVLYSIITVIILWGLYTARSRTVWATMPLFFPGFVIAHYIFIKKNIKIRLRHIPIAIGSIFVVGLIGYFTIKGMQEHFPVVKHWIGGFKASSGSRLAMWKDSIKMIWDYPIFGSGLGTIRPIFMPYISNLLRESHIDNPHNNYLAIWSQLGILGLGTFLWMIYRWAKGLITVINLQETSKNDRLLALTIFLSLMNYLWWQIPWFDNVSTMPPTILLLFFSHALFRHNSIELAGKKEQGLVNALSNKLIIPISIILIPFGITAMYHAFNAAKADNNIVKVSKVSKRYYAGDMKKFNFMRKHLTEAHELFPYEFTYTYKLGALYLRRHMQLKNSQSRKLAEEWLKKALIHSWSPDIVYEKLMRLYVFDKNLNDAIWAATKLYQLRHYEPKNSTQLAKLLIYKNRINEAQQYTIKALSIEPKNLDANVFHAMILFAKRDDLGAYKYITRARENHVKMHPKIDYSINKFLKRIKRLNQ